MKIVIPLALLAHSLSSPAFAVLNGAQVASLEEISETTAAYINVASPSHLDPAVLNPLFCTATLLTDRIAVTAAHCVKSFYSKPELVFGVNARQSKVFRSITGFMIPQNYKTGYAEPPIPKNNHDLALILFEGGLPLGYHSAKLLPVNYKFVMHEPIWFAGYGFVVRPNSDPVHMWDPWDDGILRKAQGSISDPYYASQELQVAEHTDQVVTKGDSGGPAYLVEKGKTYIVGVCNWGSSSPQFEVYADLRAHLVWIKEASALLLSGKGSTFCNISEGCSQSDEGSKSPLN